MIQEWTPLYLYYKENKGTTVESGTGGRETSYQTRSPCKSHSKGSGEKEDGILKNILKAGSSEFKITLKRRRDRKELVKMTIRVCLGQMNDKPYARIRRGIDET